MKLKKSFLFIVMLFSFSFLTKSEAQVNVGFNGGVQVPFSLFGNLVKTGYGGMIYANYEINRHLAITLSTGYNKWTYKSSYDLYGNVVHVNRNNSYMYSVPVMVGVRLLTGFPRSRLKPYLGIDAGIMFSNSSTSGSVKGKNIIYSLYIGAGYELIPEEVTIELNVRELSFQETINGIANSWYGVNAGISVGL